MRFVLVVIPSIVLADQVPISGTYPGWVNGEGRTGIIVEVFFDLMCSDSAASNPIWNETLQTPWLDGTVLDQVHWSYTT
jgi:hypothetical protein